MLSIQNTLDACSFVKMILHPLCSCVSCSSLRCVVLPTHHSCIRRISPLRAHPMQSLLWLVEADHTTKTCYMRVPSSSTSPPCPHFAPTPPLAPAALQGTWLSVVLKPREVYSPTGNRSTDGKPTPQHAISIHTYLHVLYINRATQSTQFSTLIYLHTALHSPYI